MRTGGADAIAFDPTCLVGPNAALPHGSPSDAAVRTGQVVLFDFGAEVDGYRSDMTRTLFVGEPAERDLAVYELVANAQAAVIAPDPGDRRRRAGASVGPRAPRPRPADDRGRRALAGRTATGSATGSAWRRTSCRRSDRTRPATPLPSPTVFSVEPGIYLEGETGVRIEDLVLLDAGARRVERLTQFPREVMVVPG